MAISKGVPSTLSEKIVSLSLNQQALRDICNSLQHSVKTDKQLSYADYERLGRLYDNIMKHLPKPPKPKLQDIPKDKRECQNCGTHSTYVYNNNPKWHFYKGKIYCHKCYSSKIRLGEAA